MLRSERALEIFRQWLVYKIVIAIHESLGDQSPESLVGLSKSGLSFIDELQTSVGQSPTAAPPPLPPARLLEYIDEWCLQTGRTRAVLLMDDAAHAFMHQQQREFFEVFRALRSRTVACKAAIYPGVTSYSPFFNVGHEAEEIEVWIRPDSPEYLTAMHSIFRARFPEALQGAVRKELIEMAAQAAFGLPRNFLNILSDSIGTGDDEEVESITAPTLAKLRDAIRQNADRVRSLFGEVGKKLPRYESFITVGSELYTSMIAEIRDTNRQRQVGVAKYIGVAVAQPWQPELAQVIALLEYAGLVRKIGVVSRGVSRYEKIQLHTSLLLADNALSLGRNPSAEDTNRALLRQSADDFVRRQPERLLPPDWSALCRLNLSPCPKCGTARVSEDAVFCFKCGTALTEQSVYIELLESPIERLNLPALKLERILESTNMKTVQDILLDDGGARLRTVQSIGSTWSARIRARANEYTTL